MNQVELLRLFGALSDQTISEMEHQKLQELLLTDPEARRLWFLFNDIESGLAGIPVLELDPEIGREAKIVPFIRSRVVLWAIAAAVTVLLGLGGLVLKPEPEPFISLTASTKAAWSDPNVELSFLRGELPLGMLHLASGLAEFRFASGATMVVEGPAEFKPLGSRRVFMRSGNLWCRCPGKESQVTVVTQEAEVTDLGTEFAVSAAAGEGTKVKVLSGEVKVDGLQSLRIKQGEAVAVSSDRIIRPIKPAPGDFQAPSMLPGGSKPTGENWLRDPGFEEATKTWSGSGAYTELAPEKGRSGSAAKIRALGSGLWPLVSQTVSGNDLSGKIVSFSAWGMNASEDPLRERQCAILKVQFLDARGRTITYAERRFLSSKEPRDKYLHAVLSAIAPEETKALKAQILLNASSLKTGSAYFDDAELLVLPNCPE